MIAPPPLDEVKTLSQAHEDRFVSIWLRAWDQWMQNPHRLQLNFRRTRANAVFNYAMTIAMPELEGVAGVAIVRRQGNETAAFIIDQRLFLRLKKANRRGLGSNVRTQASLAFQDSTKPPLLSLPDVWKVEVVYVLNYLETMIERIMVVARHKESLLWAYEIYSAAGSMLDLPPPPVLPVQPPPPKPVADVLKVPGADVQIKNKKGEGE